MGPVLQPLVHAGMPFTPVKHQCADIKAHPPNYITLQTMKYPAKITHDVASRRRLLVQKVFTTGTSYQQKEIGNFELNT